MNTPMFWVGVAVLLVIVLLVAFGSMSKRNSGEVGQPSPHAIQQTQ